MRMKNSIEPLGRSSPATSPSLELSGEVQELDLAHRTLRITADAPRPSINFLMDDDLPLMSEAQREGLTELRAGQHVTVRYTRDGSRLLAHRVALIGAKP
jgi:hypothetical protein